MEVPHDPNKLSITEERPLSRDIEFCVANCPPLDDIVPLASTQASNAIRAQVRLKEIIIF